MPEVRFAADVMVGKLARWLRVLGLDVVYSNRFEDDELIQLAQSEDRILLTRDTRLAARCGHKRCLLIESGDHKEQVQQVIRAFGLTEFNVLSRCIKCNTSLAAVSKEEVFERIPPYVYLTQEHFALCPTCNRVYWHGTHADEMLKSITRM